MKAKKIVCLLLLALAAVLAFSGPFGLEQGMTLEEITNACGGKNPVDLGGGRYLVQPAKTHPSFAEYVAYVSETEGLYALTASTKEILSDEEGKTLQKRFHSLVSSISKTYGDCRLIDEIDEGSKLTEQIYWIHTLRTGERKLEAWWLGEDGALLSDDVQNIYLAVKSTSYLKARIALRYRFANFDKAKDTQDSVF